MKFAKDILVQQEYKTDDQENFQAWETVSSFSQVPGSASENPISAAFEQIDSLIVRSDLRLQWRTREGEQRHKSAIYPRHWSSQFHFSLESETKIWEKGVLNCSS